MNLTDDVFCIACDDPIPHHKDHSNDCPTDKVTGRCVHLVATGAVPIWIRVFTDSPNDPTFFGEHILSRGGWICKACADRFGVKHAQTPRPPKRSRTKARVV